MCVNWNELRCASSELQPVATRLPGVRLPLVCIAWLLRIVWLIQPLTIGVGPFGLILCKVYCTDCHAIKILMCVCVCVCVMEVGVGLEWDWKWVWVWSGTNYCVPGAFCLGTEVPRHSAGCVSTWYVRGTYVAFRNAPAQVLHACSTPLAL